MSSSIANRLSPDTREQLARIRRRPPKRTRDAEREAEIAATLAHLEAQGWQTCDGLSVALCPICNQVNAVFVARRLRDEHSPMIVRCTACAGKRQA